MLTLEGRGRRILTVVQRLKLRRQLLFNEIAEFFATHIVMLLHYLESHFSVLSDLVDTTADVMNETVVLELAESGGNCLPVQIDIIGDVCSEVPPVFVEVVEHKPIRLHLKQHSVSGHRGGHLLLTGTSDLTPSGGSYLEFHILASRRQY